MFRVLERNFVATRHPFRKRVSGCIHSTSFCHRNHFFVFRNEHAQSTNLGPKLMFGWISCTFVAARHPFRKRVSGAYKLSFCHRNNFFVFRNVHAQSTTLGPKLMFGIVSHNFVAARHPFRKQVSGCIQSTSFCHRNHFFVFRNEHAQSTNLGPKLMFGIVSHNFLAARHPFQKRVSGCIQSMSFYHRNHFFILRNKHAQSTTLGPKLMFGIVSHNFLAARHPFRKRVLGCIQSTSFCHRNHFFVFRNEHAQSTTIGPKLMFGVLSCNFVTARHSFRKRVSAAYKLSFCQRNHFFVFRNEHAQSTTLGPKLMFGIVSHNFVAARHPFRKRVPGCIQSTSFCHRNHFFVFRNEHAQSTTLGLKLMFGVLSCNFVAARQPFRKRVSGCIQSTSFLPPEPFLRFSQQTCPIHYFRSKTHVWGGFAQFLCRTSPIPKTGIRVHTKHEFLPPEPFLCFSQRTCPIHYFRSKTHVWGGFAQFCCRMSLLPKTGIGVHTKHEFLPPQPFLHFSQQTCPIHYFRS
jgi:hypothetical protein